VGTRKTAPALLLALLASAGGCASPAPPTGLAAARARGAGDGGAEPPPAAAGADDAPASPPAPVDQLLDFSRAVARVNGRTIVLREVRIQFGPSWENYLNRREDLLRLADERLRAIVLRRLLVAEAERIGLTLPEGVLEKEEERQRKAAEAEGTTLDQHARDMGTTRREMSQATAERLMADQARAFFTGYYPPHAYDADTFRPSVDFFVSPDEVRAWGRAHPDRVSVPASARLRLLDLRVDEFRRDGASDAEARAACLAAAERARDRARAGEGFADLVRELSHGYGREEGGLLPPMGPTGSERAEYRAWAFAPERKVGDVSDPIPLPSGAVVLYVEERSGGGTLPIAQWGPIAREELEGIKREIAWIEVRVRLVEEASIEPRELRDQILARLEEERRAAVSLLPPPEPPVRATSR
jgi:hypothetical protein